MTPARPAPILLLALILTVLLTAGWTVLAWGELSRMVLPDTDDMMRLAQIRDWLNGQPFDDLTQYRMGGLGGIAMHWSRLPDLVPAAVATLLTPFMGATRAELAAVVFWPELLFLLHLLLAGRIASRLSDDKAAGVTAVVLAAVAYPAISMFVPGRIDHHGLQIVLVEAMLLALLDRRAFVAGLWAATSLMVGLETAPLVAAAMLFQFLHWVELRRGAADFGAAFLAVTLTGFLLLRPRVWTTEWCDSFTPGLFALMMIASGAWLVLGGLTPRLPDRRWRIGAGLTLGALALVAGWAVAPRCFASPYGPVDPLLAKIWLGNVGEAGGILAQKPGTVIAYIGLPLVALAAAGWFWKQEHERRDMWLAPLLLIGVSVALAFIQIRTAYAAAALAAPVLAHLIARARLKGTAAMALAWLASAGLVWQGIGNLAGSATAAPAIPQAGTGGGASCTSATTLQQFDKLELGNVAAPIDMGAYLVGRTGLRVLDGPYHRNNRGNRAMYDFFLADVNAARYQASLWEVDYVTFCPDSFGEVPANMVKPNSLLAHLRAGDTPDWLRPLPLIDSQALLWRVLPPAPRGR
jgi:multisubunit Na+/H+ antiporter MnhG subunit